MVKKAAEAVPNARLREARERLGWSQEDLAKFVKTTKDVVSRWERGATFPYPHTRQRLCELFGKSEEELGLIPRKRSAKAAHADRAATAISSEPTHEGIKTPPAVAQPYLVGRFDEQAQLKKWLCAKERTPFTAIYGLPGVGKTSLALTIARDEDICRHYSAGILRADIGPQPNIPELLSQWASALHITENNVPSRAEDVEGWTHTLRHAISTRRMLFILDDVWSLEDAAALTVGGPNCSYLLITRSPIIALHYAGDRALMLHPLSGEDSIMLLRHYAPAFVARHPEEAASIIRAFGGLPLALRLIGESLREHDGERSHGRIIEIDGRGQAVAPTIHELTALYEAIALSDRHLSGQGRAALRALSIFPPAPESFSEDDALAITNLPVTVLDELSDAGLLESRGSGRYALHPTIAAYGKMYRNE